MARKKRLHKKKRNSALLYEFLIRHISKCLVDDKKEEANKAFSLSKKFFSKGTLLHDELCLFNVLLNTNVKSLNSAQKVINEVCLQASKMNVRNLDIEKSKLIKEINHIFNNDAFYDYKIPNYTVYASVQTLLGEIRNKRKVLTSVDKIKLEDTIAEYLVKGHHDEIAQKLKTNPKYSNAVYKFVIQRFHEKYDKSLNEDQKKLLTKYAIYLISENKGVIKSAIEKEVKLVKETLKNIQDEPILKDPDLLKKMNECYKKLVSTDFDNISEDNIMEILQYMKLKDEINS